MMLVGFFALPAAALAAGPAPLDLGAGAGHVPQIAYDHASSITYVAWTDPASDGIDLCLLPADADACSGGAPVVLQDAAQPAGRLGALVVLSGGEVVVLGATSAGQTVAWASGPEGRAFSTADQGLQNAGAPMSSVGLASSPGNAAALGDSDVGVLAGSTAFDDFALGAPAPASPPDSNPIDPSTGAVDFGTVGANSTGSSLAAMPDPAIPGSAIVVGVGSNAGGTRDTTLGCQDAVDSGFGVAVGRAGSNSTAGYLDNQATWGRPWGLLACGGANPVLGSGPSGIGVLETETTNATKGTDTSLVWRPFSASTLAFASPVALADVTFQPGVLDLDVSEDPGGGIYALWVGWTEMACPPAAPGAAMCDSIAYIPHTMLDHSADGGVTWSGPTDTGIPGGSTAAVAGTGGGGVAIAYALAPDVYVQGIGGNPPTSAPTPTPAPAPGPTPTPLGVAATPPGPAGAVAGASFARPLVTADPVAVAGRATSRGANVDVPISCRSAAPCSVAVTLHADRGHRAVTVGSGHFTIKGHRTATLHVRLSKAGRALLIARHQHLAASVTIAVEKVAKTVTRKIEIGKSKKTRKP